MSAPLFTMIAIIAALTAGPAVAEPLAGPVRAHVVQVVDGDTYKVVAQLWLDQTLTISVRLRGVDTPELHSRCQAERDAAAHAKAWVEARLSDRDVALEDIDHDKYAARAVARVRLPDGEDLAAGLIGAGHARAYDGGRKEAWCDESGVLREGS